MSALLNQRWRFGRHSFLPAGEPIRTAEYEVATMPGDAEAKAFVVAHHYSGTFPAARARFGLYRRGVLAGVAVFSQPINDASLACLPGASGESAELGRFVLLDSVPGNGETWFLARAFECLRREGWVGVVSFSDPEPRQRADGTTVFPGHIGTIYQAHNAVYLGRGTSRTLRLLPDGTVLSDRTIQKIRARERGWTYGVEQLVRAGAEPPHPNVDLREWLADVLPRVTRRLRHPGNHKYAWTLQSRHRRHLPASRPYPKRFLEAA
ncbi:MAG: hypothetical protein L0Y66_09880 [Myxococcaceae bacterium]|nr:hypothetical protein [Myxococcaceae bacterium]MCI0673252.1 hypothetical protein [Myxococcaceae bacterium]